MCSSRSTAQPRLRVDGRRRWPCSVVSSPGSLFAAAHYPVALTPVALLSIYTAAATLAPKPARLLLAGAVVLGIIGTTASPGPTNTGVPASIASAWLLGNYVGSRRAYAAELEDKNRQLEQARLELADRAVAEERLRIARELHDVVSHTMSVVAVHAGTGRMVAQDDPAAARRRSRRSRRRLAQRYWRCGGCSACCADRPVRNRAC